MKNTPQMPARSASPEPAEAVAGQRVPVDRLTLEEKASLTSGADHWRTQAVARVGVPALVLADGPHGLRKPVNGFGEVGIGASAPATCFPPAVALGATFDPELAERVGAALGAEAAAAGVAVLLGPGINIKRTPLCGRNFEYLSEDPLVSGELGASMVRGIQSRGVGASLKHFAANNQETDRHRTSSDIDPRPLREIYLRGFQRVVEDAQPWTVMCSYNRLNGVQVSQDPWLLTQVLREEWGFTGLVMSDWGAVVDRIAAVQAGLDLEMPSSGGRTDAELVAAVRDGRLAERELDAVADRVLELANRAAAAEPHPVDFDAHHALAREVAARSIVLLRNEGELLPLRPSASVAVIGAFAAGPRYQGDGSSRVVPTRIDTALNAIRGYAQGEVVYARGFEIDPLDTEAATGRDGATRAAELRDEAVAIAETAETVVLFLGLPAHEESEGFDRAHIDLPAEQLVLLDNVIAANPNVVVVLSHGGTVSLPFADRVPAILDASLLGQAGGSGTADVLFGAVNPSARLTETIPLRLEDTPGFGSFPGEEGHVRYGEGVFVGYRWYDIRELEVRFPFGHGLSYTTFEMANARAVPTDEGIELTVTVTNTGSVPGREVVQVYAGLEESAVRRPTRELRGFGDVQLGPGASADVVIRIRRSDLAYWSVREDRWVVETGRYTLDVGASSRDIRATATVEVEGDERPLPVTLETTFDELMADPETGVLLETAMEANGVVVDQATRTFLGGVPVGRLDGFPLPRREMETLIQVING